MYIIGKLTVLILFTYLFSLWCFGLFNGFLLKYIYTILIYGLFMFTFVIGYLILAFVVGVIAGLISAFK